jgi:arsenate reductase
LFEYKGSIMSITIYHNNACGTSRKTLEAIRATGVEPEIIDYVKNPPSRGPAGDDRQGRPHRAPGHAQQGRPVCGAGPGRHVAVGRGAAGCDDGASYPDRTSIRGDGKGVRLCRPSELVQDIL